MDQEERPPSADVRPSPIAGTWYPGSKAALSASIDAALADGVRRNPPGDVIALLVPHAGHRYSGRVAAAAYNCVRESALDLVIIVAPIHRPYRSPILTSGHSAYGTPLGDVPIDSEALASFNRSLKTSLGTHAFPVRDDQEHSLEIQLPFLQRTLKAPFSLLPIMLSETRFEHLEAVGAALTAAAEGRSALLIASSDLSHFYPQELAQKLDREMLSRITAMQPDRVLSAEREGVGFACGRSAIAAVLMAARTMGGNRVELLSYATSGDVTGDFDSVVGYGSAVILRTT